MGEYVRNLIAPVVTMFQIATMLCMVMSSTIVRARHLVIGAKRGVESQIIAEMLSALLSENLIKSELKLELAGTQIAFGALRSGAIDLYVDYSGTIDRVILKQPQDLSFVRRAMLLASEYDIEVFPSIGFQNSYALAIRSKFADEHAIAKISDLNQIEHHKVIYGFDHEFIRRDDGFQGLNRMYNLLSTANRSDQLIAMDHDLSYSALRHGSIDVMDIYSTDAKLLAGDIRLIEDDLDCFPNYEAMPLVRSQALIQYPKLRWIVSTMVGRINEQLMIKMNARAELDRVSPHAVARQFLSKQGLIKQEKSPNIAQARLDGTRRFSIPLRDIGKHGLRHLLLSVMSVLLATLLAIPVGIYISRRPRLSRIALGLSGVLQTVPSLALLAILLVIFVGFGNDEMAVT